MLDKNSAYSVGAKLGKTFSGRNSSRRGFKSRKVWLKFAFINVASIESKPALIVVTNEVAFLLSLKLDDCFILKVFIPMSGGNLEYIPS